MSNLAMPAWEETELAIGTSLRSARVQRGLTIEQVSQDTRISARFLEALEAEQFDELPAPVYVRGFLRSYANYLRLDPQPLLDELAGAANAAYAPPDPFAPSPRNGGNRGRRPDPFRRAAAPEPPLIEDGEDGWAPEEERRELAPIPYQRRTAPVLPPPGSHDDLPRGRRASGMGILMEREAQYNESSGGMRLLALAGGIVIILAALVVVAIARGGGGDGGSTAPGAGDDRTAARTTTIVSARSPSPAGAVAGATASPSPASSSTPGTPTNTPGPGTPTATGVPTEEPTATPVPPTNTPGPTATPVPPTPTPIPPPPHEANFDECSGPDTDLDCGESPWRVVCDPGGGWFVDVDKNYPVNQLGWQFFDATGGTQNQAILAASKGCG